MSSIEKYKLNSLKSVTNRLQYIQSFPLAHTFLLTLYPALLIYLKNLGYFSISQLIEYCFYTGLGIILATAFASRVCSNLHRTTLSISALLIMVLGFVVLQDRILDFNKNIRLLILATTFSLYFVLVLRILRRASNSQLINFTLIINVFAVILCLQPIIGRLLSVASSPPTTYLAAYTKLEETIASKVLETPQSSRPDIIYIILDGYARQDTLKNLYRYTSTNLSENLNERGFYIASQARSNYAHTLLSLPSSLNLNYLDSVSQIDTGKTTEAALSIELLQNNILVNSLRRAGYYFVNVASGFGPSEYPQANNFHNTINRNRLLLEVAQRLLVSFETILSRLRYEIHRNTVRSALHFLCEAAPSHEPTLLFAHIPSPHPPFVLNSDGTANDPSRAFTTLDGDQFYKPDQYRELYNQQIAFIDQSLKCALQNFLSKPNRPLVVIIQGDHGPASELYWGPPASVNFHERFAILNTYYFSDQNYNSLYPQISPVNSFRVVFNKYFNTQLELLPDKSFFSSPETPFVFDEVPWP